MAAQRAVHLLIGSTGPWCQLRRSAGAVVGKESEEEAIEPDQRNQLSFSSRKKTLQQLQAMEQRRKADEDSSPDSFAFIGTLWHQAYAVVSSACGQRAHRVRSAVGLIYWERLTDLFRELDLFGPSSSRLSKSS
jgi:hypothetical protein